MSRKPHPIITVTLDKIVGGGQALGTCDDGRKVFVWGALPGETARVQITKKKSSYLEGVAIDIDSPSPQRVEPRDPGSYLSTSPWQIMSPEAEQHYKAALIEEAFELHNIVLPDTIDVYGDDRTYHYRNKVEFSWYGDTDTSGTETLDLAFFRRGSKGKIAVNDCALLPSSIMEIAQAVRDALRSAHISARQLKTLLIRCDQTGDTAWQLYVKDKTPETPTPTTWKDILDHILTMQRLNLHTDQTGGEVILSDPRSPASVITERLAQTGNIVLTDKVLGVPFRYATEGFFQVNLPVYEQALRDMQRWVSDERPTIDLYSGVGTIGLTIGGPDCILVESNEHAVREMRRNIAQQGSSAQAILAPSEHALHAITGDRTIVVDPPRAGLHEDVVQRLLEQAPPRIIYLSCNPVTQARDVARLAEKYGVNYHRGYNFFPRTPHIEHLVVLDRKATA